MVRKTLLVSLLTLLSILSKAAYFPVTVTGYNSDVVANGTAGGPQLSTTNLGTTAGSPSGFDGQGYWLTDLTFNPGIGTPSAGMPTNTLFTSALDANLQYQLMPYAGNNAVRIANIGTDSMVLVTPQAAGEVYICYSNVRTGTPTGNVNITINFTDGTTQVSTGNATPNWFSGANPVRTIGNRFNGGGNSYDPQTGGPMLYQFKIAINAANYSKTVRSIKFDNTVATNLLYIFAVTFSDVCTGTPTPGSTTASASSICATESLTLSSNGTTGVGISNQWQVSTNGGGLWTDIAAGTTNPYTFTGQTVASQYRNKIICTASSSTPVYSTVVTVGTRPCYCSPSFASGCSTWRITNATFGSINNSPTACATSNYTAMSTPVTAGIAFPMSITTNQYSAAAVYIDLNNDGDFDDTDEWLYTEPYSGAATSTATPNITIPGYALPGSYRLRIVCKWGGGTGAGQACTAWPSGNYGNFHDYTVVVSNPASCYPPTNLLSSAITSTGATFTWTAPPTTTPLGYQWRIIAGTGPVTGTPVASGSMASGTLTVSPNTLSAASNYTFYIRSGCGPTSTDSSLWNQLNFTTICGGTPTPGVASTAAPSVCSGVNFNLVATGASVANGITYQWQSSPNGLAPWTAITAATATTATVSQTAITSYRLKVTCNLTDSSFSNVVTVGLNAANQCYCIPSTNTTSYYITAFTTTGGISNVNNTGTAGGVTSAGYSDYTSLPAIVGIQGNSISFSSTFSSTFGAKIWVDWNQNGSFSDPGEEMYTTTSSYVSSISGSFTIPATALPGNTRLRIRNHWLSTSGPDPCTALTTSTEAEDYTFNVIPNLPCVAPTTQPTALLLTPAVTSVAGTFTASVPAATGYIVVRTPGTTTPTVAPVNATAYTVGATLGNGVVVSVSTSATFTDAAAAPSTQYRYTIYGYNDLCVGGPAYNVTTPLTGTVTTNGVSIYTWTGLSSTDWQIAGNWTPFRVTPDASDVLQFNDGLVDSVTNIPTQTVGRILVANNTTATFKGQTGATRTLTLNSDNSAATNELDITTGSSLVSLGTANILAIKYGGAGATGRIAGTLEVRNTAVLNTFDFTSAVDTVSGTLAASGTFAGNAFTSTATNLVVTGTYQHKYTTIGGGNVPTATWGAASNVLISGYTTATGGPAGGLGQVFNNFTYNCPAQTANNQWSGTLPGTVNGTLSVISTGTGQWLWATTTTYTVVANNYSQTGGTVDFGTSTGAKTLNVAGTFNEPGGIVKATGTGAVTINFNGTALAQNVTFSDSSASGPFIYRVSNPLGINLNGTGALVTTPVFRINTGGGVQISSSAINPINTTLALTYFATGTTLTYDGTANQAVTGSVWPATNGPLNFTVNNTGTVPTNDVTLPGSRTVGGTLTITNGVLQLDNNNLTVSNNAAAAISITTPSATRMIDASGSGQLIRAIGTAANTTYLFPIGDQVGTTEYSPVSLNLVANAGVRLMGMRVVNAQHPSVGATNYLSRYWAITDTATSAYTYNGSFTYTAADVVGTEANLRLSEWNGTTWAQIPSLPNTGVLTVQGAPSSAFLPLGGMQVTGRTAATSNTYTWNHSVSMDYQVAANWTPVRNIPDPADILQFNDGQADTVKNIPAQTITRMNFTNNTTAIFQAAGANTLTLNSDNVATTDEISIAAGSSLIVNSPTNALTIAFGGTGATVNIAGTMESVSNTPNNIFNFANATATVASTGTLAAGGSNNAQAITNTTVTNLLVNGTYNYKYTTNTIAIPTASWNTGSTLLISGYTTVTGGPNGGQNQAFYNLTYNCPNQTAAANWSGTGALNVANNLTVASTGTGSWIFASTQVYTANIGNYIQTGGTFNLASGASAGLMTFNVAGLFNQTGGTFTATGASTAANAPIVNFNGTTVQNVTFFNAAPVGPFVYRVSNPAGINLNGSGTLTGTGAFNINSNGGVRISSVAANPINTTLVLSYNATGTTLTYDQPGAAVATASVWPSTAGPLNVTVNTGGSTNTIGVPFNRTIAGTLTMTSGDIDVASNNLTLGTAPASVGTLTYSAGNIRVTTGQFIRYYNVSGLPTAAGTGAGFYPIASSAGANRNVALYFSTATAFNTSGGSIGVGHTDATGLATITPVLDGTYSIDRRTNAGWNFTATGVAGAGTIGVRVTGQGLFTTTTPANLRVMQPTAVVGTHVAGTGVTATRTGLTVADLTSPYHIGANATEIGGTYIAINTGNWSTTTTWLNGLVPGVTNEAFINSGVTVTADAATNTAKALTVLPGATLNVNAAAAIVTIDSALLNNGIVNVGGGTLAVTGGTAVIAGNNGSSGITNNAGAQFNMNAGTATLGPVNGSFRAFNNSGILNVVNGTLNINGSLQLLANSTFSQTGGNINVDGNAGGVVANSIPTAVKIVNILTPNVTMSDGTFTIVDPHVGASTNTFEYNVTSLMVNASGNHIFRIGNGISTDTGFNAAYGFSINTAVASGRFAFRNLVVNSGTAANSWLVLGASPSGILGNFTINAGGEYRQAGTGTNVYIAGNLVNNGTYSALGVTNFGNYISGAASSSLAAQTVSGTGTFRNLLTAPTAKFYKISIQNNFNVTFNIGDVPFSNNVTLLASAAPAPVGPSRLVMTGTSILQELPGAGYTGGSATAGWIVGRYQKGAGTLGGFNGTFPIGDLNYYTPFATTSATVTTTGAVWAGVTAVDHPNILTSAISATRNVNRYFTVTPVNGVVFAPNATATFNWNAADVDAGANTAAFVVGKYAGTTWTYPTPLTPTATNIQSTTLDLNVTGDYVMGEGCSTPLNIATQPATVTNACLGSSTTLSVGLAASSNVTYQWQKLTGTTWGNVTGATNATYTITATVAGDAGAYRVLIGSNCPAVTGITSGTDTLKINVPASITTQPAATAAICEGSPVTFTVAAAGTNVTYQWQKGGVNITGATAATYTIPVVAPADAASYTVIVTGSAPCGFVTSNASVLTVNPLPLTITAAGPLTFCPGGSVTLNGPQTTPTNTLTYVWKNGATTVQTGGTSYLANASGSYTATITNTANGCSNTSNALVVNVSGAPTSTITPAGNASFCAGANIKLRGLNTPGLTYEWYLNGNTSTVLGTDSTYTTSVPGSYTVKVSIGSGCSNTSVPTVVTVNALPTVTTTPTGAQAICVNDTLTINGNFTGATPVWNLNGSPIPGAINASYKATVAGNYTLTVTSIANGCSNTSAAINVTVNPLPTVTVTSSGPTAFCAGGNDTLKASPTTGLTYLWYMNGAPAAPAGTAANYVVTQSGSYTVNVTNANGCSRMSTATVITVNPLPNVTVTPSLPLSICAGQTNNLCVPSAASTTYQWKDGTTNIAGATTPCYAATTAGVYSVTATNTVTGCSVTSVASTIVVNAVPTATITNSGSGIACAGDTICLNANTGAGLSYQWKINGGVIPGAIASTYCATGTGNYTVDVTNGNNCTTTSTVLTLTYNPRPSATISYTTPVTFCEGGAVVLTGVSNTGTTYQWQNNANPITGATSNNYIASATGSYSVVITAPNGCKTTSPTILVVVNPTPSPVITRTNSILSTGNYASYQWFLNTAPIAGATTQSIIASQNGGYSVYVTDVNGCTNYSPVFMINNVGVKSTLLNPSSIKVFPNPVFTMVNIEAPDKVNVAVRDLTGRLIKTVDDAKQIDMSQLPDGFYMLMISDKHGIMVKTEKVTKVSK